LSLRRREPREVNRRDFGEPDLLCRLKAGVASNDAVLAVEENGVRKPEFFDAPRELIKLRRRMGPRIAGVRHKRRNRAHHDLGGQVHRMRLLL
jgi:hypothetical protein